MRHAPKNKPDGFVEKVKSILGEAFAWRLAVRQKFGSNAFTVPVVVLIIVTILVPQLVLIAVLIALVVGYRLSFEKR
jgi:hypothetical protein